MNEPKQKPKMGKPKIIEKTLHTQDRLQDVSSKMKEHMPDGDNKNFNEYATDNVTQKGEYVARKGIKTTADTEKKAITKGYDTVKERIKTRDADHDNSDYTSSDSNKNNTHTENSYRQQNKADIKKIQTQRGETAQAENSYKNTQRTKAINNNKATDSNARLVKTKQATTNITPKTKQKTTVKATKKTIKNTRKSIKTAQLTAKKAAFAAKKSVKAAKKAVVIAKKTAKVTVRTAKVAAKAVATGIKAAIAAIKGLIAAIAAGGWVVVIIILVIALILFLVSSPWAIFFDDTDENTPTISELVVQLNNEFSGEITNIISNAGEVNGIVTDVDTSTTYLKPANWIDVLGVFAVKTSTNPKNEGYMDVLIMDEQKVEMLRDVFWDMNNITYEIEEEEIEPEPIPTPSATNTSSPSASPAPEPTLEVYRTLIINIESLTYEQGADLYNFNYEQNELIRELMSPRYYTMFMELCGMSSFNGLTPEQASQLINNLPEGELGSDIVKYALTRLGHPYSQAKRGQGNYVDCSFFARWCYQQAGVLHFTAGTAAEQARYCVNNSLTIAKSDFQPGDLVFWSFNTNGRFMNITHVGIYAGDGMVIDASSSRGMVVYRKIFGVANQVCYGRPHVE